MRYPLLLVIAALLAVALWWSELAPLPPPAAPEPTAAPAAAVPAAAPEAVAAPPAVPAPAPASARADAVAGAVSGGALRVRAVDGEGRPVAGITLWCAIDRRSAAGASSDSVQNLPATAADGTTTLADAAAQLAAPDVVGARLYANLVGAQGPTVALEPRALPTGVVDVEVPAHGRVRVEQRWADGRPWGLEVPDDWFELKPLDASGRPGNREFLARAVRGVGEYEFVALGQRFRVGSRREWGPPVDFAGPAVPGATVIIALPAAPRLRLVAGRILGADGRPCRRPVRLEASWQGGRSSGDLLLDAEGRFVAAVAAFVGPNPRLDFDAQGKGDRVSARWESPDPLLPGCRDLGDVVLREAPVLVAGRLHWLPGAATPADFRGVQLAVAWSDTGQEPWFGERLWLAIGEDGSFTHRAHPKAERYRLVVLGAVAPREAVPFAVGTTSLAVPIAPPSRLEATFVVGPGDERWMFELVPPPGMPRVDRQFFELHSPREGNGPPGFGRQRREGDRLVVEFESLGPGRYTLRAIPGGGKPAVDFPVEVPAPGATSPSLLEFDLRGH